MSQSPAVEILRRWEQSGTIWRFLSRASSRVTLSLLSCDGGEGVDRLASDDPDLYAYVGARLINE